MAVKNLTDVYMLMRSNSVRAKHTLEEFHDEAGDTVALVSPDLESGLYRGKKVLQPPLWTDNLEQITAELVKIRNHLRDLDRLHDKHLNRPSLMDDHSEERRIQTSTQTIGQLLHDCQSHVSIINRSASGKNEGSAERQLTENVVRAVAGQLRDVTEQFRQRQTDYCNRIKQRNNAGSFFDNLQAEQSPTETILQNDMMFVTTQDLLTSEEVAQREQEIQGVVRSIHDLNAVFKEVAQLVVEQGSVVDRIDYNVEHVQASVQQGLQQLHKAAAYQRGNAKLKCIVILTVVTVFMTIVLFVTKLS
ncbi:syntaxin-16 [Galendromus occidentalis]|uniref:Syntaxin-16 n=1 Tax=Galendromus occidentalis TaxID=34638 RepID=A0AAJ7WHW7_9ACAR|nr:syntaxin-16 [Galendromus occidentalis]